MTDQTTPLGEALARSLKEVLDDVTGTKPLPEYVVEPGLPVQPMYVFSAPDYAVKVVDMDGLRNMVRNCNVGEFTMSLARPISV